MMKLKIVRIANYIATKSKKLNIDPRHRNLTTRKAFISA